MYARTPTGIQLRAVRIPKNQLAGGIGTVQHDGKLVESDSAMAVAQAARQVAGHGSRCAPHVDDDEVVTAGMHFPKSKWHCQSVEIQAVARLILPARHSESQGGHLLSNQPSSKRQAGQPDTRRGHCRLRCVRPATRRLPTYAHRGVIRYVPRCRATRVVRLDTDVLSGDDRVFSF